MNQVTTLKKLVALALKKKAVISYTMPCLRKPQPAAWVQNWQGVRIQQVMNSGLYVYTPKSKPRRTRAAVKALAETLPNAFREVEVYRGDLVSIEVRRAD